MLKSDAMARAIEGRIICGGFAPGQKIPSLRQLIVTYKVSLHTAERGIAKLVERGLLESRHGAGTFVVAMRRDPHPCRIGILYAAGHVMTEYSYSGLALLGATDRAVELKMPIKRFLDKPINDSFIKRLGADCEGLILLGGYDAFLKCPDPGIPCVGVAMHRSYGGWFSLIDLDPHGAAEQAGEFFKNHHCKTITLITGTRRLNFDQRAKLFIEHWRESGGEVIQIDINDPTPFNRLRGDGCLFVDGNTAVDFSMRYTCNTGRDIWNDFPTLCIDGKPLFSHHRIDMPTIAINWRLAGELAVDECMRRIRFPGRAARRIYMEPKLYTEPTDQPRETNRRSLL